MDVPVRMSRDIISPEGADLESPGRRDYWIALPHTSIWGAHLIPLTVFVGPAARPGEGLVAFGACHGNEYEGPVAIKHLLGEVREEDVLGRLILVPVLNVAAFRVGTRDSTGDDGLNLNRVFVDGAGTSPAMASITYRIVEFVRRTILPHVHICIDLHSGGEVGRFAQSVSYFVHDDPVVDAQREEMARWFGVPVVKSNRSSPSQSILRGLYHDAAELGKHTVTTELGYGSSIDPRGVRYARQGVLAAAIHQGQLSGTVTPIGHHADGTQKVVRNTTIVAAPYPGHYEPLVECGEVVSAGQTAGLLHDFYRLDENPLEVVSSLTGVILTQAWGARVEQGQAILVVGEEVG